MRDEGPLHIDVQVVTDGDDVMISVADDGLGMDEEVAQRLLEGQHRSPAATDRQSILTPDGSVRGADRLSPT